MAAPKQMINLAASALTPVAIGTRIWAAVEHRDWLPHVAALAGWAALVAYLAVIATWAAARFDDLERQLRSIALLDAIESESDGKISKIR